MSEAYAVGRALSSSTERTTLATLTMLATLAMLAGVAAFVPPDDVGILGCLWEKFVKIVIHVARSAVF